MLSIYHSSRSGRRQRGTVSETSPCTGRGEAAGWNCCGRTIGEIFFVSCSRRAMEPPVPFDDRAQRRSAFAPLASGQWSHGFRSTVEFSATAALAARTRPTAVCGLCHKKGDNATACRMSTASGIWTQIGSMSDVEHHANGGKVVVQRFGAWYEPIVV